MIQLKITLGNSFVEKFYLMYDMEFGEIQPRIAQHTMVLSEKIIKYYEDYAQSCGALDLCKTYLQSIMGQKSKCEFVQDFGAKNMIEELIAVASSQPMKVLLAEKNEIKKAPRGINLLTCNDIKKNDGCIINLYSLPISCRYVRNNEKTERYSAWLGNWLKGEKNIIIRDKYLLSDNGIASFKKFYLPIFEKGANISIYTDEDVEERFITEFDKEEYSEYHINIYKGSRMHERVIILDDFQIVIGKGLDFLRADKNNTAESFISITKVTIDTEEEMITQLR